MQYKIEVTDFPAHEEYVPQIWCPPSAWFPRRPVRPGQCYNKGKQCAVGPSARSDISRLNSVMYVIALASRGRGFSQYWAGVAGSPPSPSTAMVVAQPVALETSPPACMGKS